MAKQTNDLESIAEQLASIFGLSNIYDIFLGDFIDIMSLLRIVRDSMGEELSVTESQDRKKLLTAVIDRMDEMHNNFDNNLEKWLEENMKKDV